MLNQLKLSTTVECLTLEANGEWLAVHDLEEDTEVMLSDFFGVVQYVKIHLLTRGQRATSWLNLKDLFV